MYDVSFQLVLKAAVSFSLIHFFRGCYILVSQALDDCGILKNIRRVAGSSAGAICAGLVAVGCSPQEIANVFKCDIKWLFHGTVFALNHVCVSSHLV
jgi:hypothetical protein